MAAVQAADPQSQGGTGKGDPVVGLLNGDAQTAGSAYKHIPLGAGIHVEQPFGGDAAAIKTEGTFQAHLLPDGEEALQRRVFQVVAGQEGHHVHHGIGVVRAQGGAGGLQPAVLNPQLQRILGEVVDGVVVFLTNHVGMALDEDGRQVFTALGAGFLHKDVEQLIPVALDAVGGGEVHQVLADGLLIVGAVVDLGDLLKITQGVSKKIE